MPRLKHPYYPTDRFALVMADRRSDIIADRAGIARSHLSQIKTGKRAVSIGRAEQIAKALGHPVDELFARKPEADDAS